MLTDVHAGEFDNHSTVNEKRRAGSANSKKIVTVTLWMPSAEKLYLGVREEYVLKNMTRRLWVFLDCYVACCGPDHWSFEMLT